MSARIMALDALKSINSRMAICIADGLTAAEAYDSFFKEIAEDSIAALEADIAQDVEPAGYTGISDEVDFSTDRWTFLMDPGYRVSAGQYLITEIKKATS